MPAQPTIAVRESRTDLLEVGPSTGLRGGNYKLIYVIGKGVYRWRTGDQSSNVPGSNDADNWVAPSEDTSGKSGAWQIDDSGILDPEHATDSGTDAFVSATNTGTPGTGAVIVRDFQSANTTTTPTLDGKTMTTKDGSALWAGAIDGVHVLQYDSGADTYLVLEPLPIDEDDMSSDSATAVPTQQSVKAFVDNKVQRITDKTTVTSVSEVDISIPANCIELIIDILEALPSTDSADLRARVSNDGGANFDDGASDYAYDAGQPGSSTIAQNDSASGMVFTTTNLGNAGDEGTAARIRVVGPRDSGLRTTFYGHTSGWNTSKNHLQNLSSGTRNADQDDDAIRLDFGVGNIASMTYVVYAIFGS